ncbi:hypothetical protein HPB47_004621 [Ixodes persulcatus]|uniref:Uncharacterized protein n=1 Tax=Ixodes persulcatus TaxID=34615 RepID=A0AC60PF66_IXOPE|nr:hypothetical protein HPB47_004621 [Ixodes persulcatus]
MLASKITSHDLEQQLRDTFFPPPTDTPHNTRTSNSSPRPCDMDAPFPLNELKRHLTLSNETHHLAKIKSHINFSAISTTHNSSNS